MHGGVVGNIGAIQAIEIIRVLRAIRVIGVIRCMHVYARMFKVVRSNRAARAHFTHSSLTFTLGCNKTSIVSVKQPLPTSNSPSQP